MCVRVLRLISTEGLALLRLIQRVERDARELQVIRDCGRELSPHIPLLLELTLLALTVKVEGGPDQELHKQKYEEGNLVFAVPLD